MDINTMIHRQLKMTTASRGALLAVTLLSALAVSGCGDKNEQEWCLDLFEQINQIRMAHSGLFTTSLWNPWRRAKEAYWIHNLNSELDKRSLARSA